MFSVRPENAVRIADCRGAMGIAMPFGAYRPAFSSSFACPARTRRPLQRRSPGFLKALSGCYSNQHRQQPLRTAGWLSRGKLVTPRRLGRVGSPASARSPAPGSPGLPRSEPSARPLGCPHAAPKEVDNAVRTPFLDGQRSLVPEARALSHYSGDTLLEKAENSNLNRCPDRMPVFGAGERKKPRV
jgi:hypothetical protein